MKRQAAAITGLLGAAVIAVSAPISTGLAQDGQIPILRIRPDISRAASRELGDWRDRRARRRSPGSSVCRAASRHAAEQRALHRLRRHAAQSRLLHSSPAGTRIRPDRKADPLVGRSWDRIRLAANRARRVRRSERHGVARRQRRERCATPEVHARREVPAAVRQARRPRRQQRHQQHGTAGKPHRRSDVERGLRRGRLSKPARNRPRRRHVRVQAAVGRCTATSPTTRRSDPTIPMLRRRSNSVCRTTSRSHATVLCMSPTGRTIAFRFFARTAPTSRRCSSRSGRCCRARPPVSRFRPIRSSVFST